MSARKRGIISRMAEMKDMCKLVRYVDSDKYDNTVAHKMHDDKQALTQLVDLYADRGYIRKRIYKRSRSKIAGVLADAFEHKYLKMASKDESSVSTAIAIDTTPKGRHFIAKKWFIYPAGLVDDSLKAYGRSQRFYLALLGGGGIGALLSGIIIYLLSH